MSPKFLALDLSMECVLTRGDNTSPHPTENDATPLIHADPFLLTPNRREFDAEYPAWPSPPPSTMDSQDAEKSRFLRIQLPRSKPLFRGFERPSFSRIAALTLLCLITYPVFRILELVAKNKTLFVVRSIVSVWCAGVGFALGYILLKIGAQHLEAASEFTLVWYRNFLIIYFIQPGRPSFT